jgi:predicted AAA+ superfamily ATPase
VLRVEPYFGNRTKRLIKAPKFVFLDTGLAAFLGGFRSVRELTESGLIGAFWESHVFGQILRQAASRGNANSVGYWRTAGGPEVDVVIERAGLLTAIECKWKEHPRDGDANGLRALELTEPKRVKLKMIVCRTRAVYRLSDGTWVLNTADALKRLASV